MVGGSNLIILSISSQVKGQESKSKPSILVNEISKRKVHDWFIRRTQTLRESVPDNSTLDS
jgi:hypothetical protein